MKKIISIVFAIIMFVGSISAVPAYAAAKETISVPVSGIMLSGSAYTAMEKVNAGRKSKSLSEFSIDSNLNAIAQRRAAEIMVYADAENDILPNGDSISTLLPGYGTTEETIYAKVNVGSSISDSLYNELSGLESESFNGIKSIGIGFFSYKSYYSCYIILSSQPAKAVASKGTDAKYTLNVNIAPAYLSTVYFDAEDSAYGYRAILNVFFYSTGICRDAFAIPSSQINVISRNPKINKVKKVSGKICVFPKKNGKFTFDVKTLKGTVIYTFSNTSSAFKNVKITATVKSKKKKTAAVSWSPMISDFTGYEIQYSTDKKFRKGVKKKVVKGAKKNKATLKKLKSKKTYYVRVRSYLDQGSGEKAYTSWSKVKKVKVK